MEAGKEIRKIMEMEAIEDLKDDMDERMDRLEARFEGLKAFVFNHMKADSRLEEDTSSGPPLASSTPLPKGLMKRSIDEVQDEELREGIRKHLKTQSCPSSEKLSDLQLAFLHYFYENRGGYSARITVIHSLIRRGEEEGIWEEEFQPAGVKKSFPVYLKEKVRNIMKKEFAKQSCDEFVKQFTANSLGDSSC